MESLKIINKNPHIVNQKRKSVVILGKKSYLEKMNKMQDKNK